MAEILQAVIKNTRQLALANKAANTVLAKGELLMLTAGLAVPATSSTIPADLLGVCNQSISAADALTQVLYIVPSDEDTYIFPTNINSDSASNGEIMILTNSLKVANTGTTAPTGIVQQVEPYGAAADRLIIGRLLTA